MCINPGPFALTANPRTLLFPALHLKVTNRRLARNLIEVDTHYGTEFEACVESPGRGIKLDNAACTWLSTGVQRRCVDMISRGAGGGGGSGINQKHGRCDNKHAREG